MTGAPHSTLSAAGRKPAEDRLHEHGIQLISLLSAVIRIGRSYAVASTVVRAQLSALATAVRSAQEQCGELVLVALDTDLFLNGARIPVSTTSLRYHHTVIEALSSRSVTGIRFAPGTSAEDLGILFGLFLSPSCPHGAALVQACAEARLERVTPVFHATTAPLEPGDAFEVIESSAAIDDAPAEGDAAPGPDAAALEPAPWSGQRHYAAAFEAAGPVFMDLADGRIDLRRVRRVVHAMVEGAAAGRPVVAGLSEPYDSADYLRAHSVNVCAVAVTMGAHLGIDRKALADLGAAALLHDSGMTAIPAEIVHPFEVFTPEERAIAERHPIEGARLIAEATPLNATSFTCMRAALEHHGGPGGYPEFPRDWSDSVLSRIVATADCYVNLQARACEMIQSATPHEALGMMLGPLAKQFHPALLWSLVQALGFYPPGQRVELSDGSIATVIAPDRGDPARPHARVIVAEDGRPLGLRETRALTPIPATMSVRRALPRSEDPERFAQAA